MSQGWQYWPASGKLVWKSGAEKSNLVMSVWVKNAPLGFVLECGHFQDWYISVLGINSPGHLLDADSFWGKLKQWLAETE